MDITVRAEAPGDVDRIRAINESAFETPAEANLIEELRRSRAPLISLVAEARGDIFGHILFSPVTIGACDAFCFGLGPMAVEPDRQRHGIGSLLVTAGLERCRESGAVGIVVLGHPDFYPRFGFQPASTYGISCEYDVPDEVFMALALTDEGLTDLQGVARYHGAFAAV